jgi:hypothetical protein
VKLASEISNNDLDWILTLDAENGLWDMYRKHPTNKNGTIDYGCGLNNAHHKDMVKKIINKSASEKEILEYCYATYKTFLAGKSGPFYGYYRRFDKVFFKGKWIPRKNIFQLTK